MNGHHKRFLAAAFAVAFGSATTVSATVSASLSPEPTQASVTYVSGGIGDGQCDA